MSLQNKRARFHSDAGSLDCPRKSSLPACFYELSKDEDPHVCQNDKTIHFPDGNAISDARTDTIDTICFPFVAGCSTIPISIESYEFRCLVDTGAAITAASANVWNKCLRHVCPSLDDSDLENIASVNGGVLKTLEKTMMHFVIQSEVFPFEAYVIEKLTYDVILGRDFIKKFSSKINFEKGRIKFVSERDLLAFSWHGRNCVQRLYRA